MWQSTHTELQCFHKEKIKGRGCQGCDASGMGVPVYAHQTLVPRSASLSAVSCQNLHQQTHRDIKRGRALGLLVAPLLVLLPRDCDGTSGAVCVSGAPEITSVNSGLIKAAMSTALGGVRDCLFRRSDANLSCFFWKRPSKRSRNPSLLLLLLELQPIGKRLQLQQLCLFTPTYLFRKRRLPDSQNKLFFSKTWIFSLQH